MNEVNAVKDESERNEVERLQPVVMRNCANCKYWDNNHTSWNIPKSLGVGVCIMAKMLWDSTEWDGESEDDEMNPIRKFTNDAKNEKAFVQDASDYKAQLITKPDFGCVQFDFA